jgi:hypothetical protein
VSPRGAGPPPKNADARRDPGASAETLRQTSPNPSTVRRLYLVRGAQRLLLGEFNAGFFEAARQALEAYKHSLRRLELDGWYVEDDRGAWAPLPELMRKRTPRKSPALALAFE